MSENENKKNAAERIQDLEVMQDRIIQAISSVQPMLQELQALKEAVKLLNNKLDAVVGSVNANLNGEITDSQLNNLMVERNVHDLSLKVQRMVADDLLSASETISVDSFVVISEANPEGVTVNPRMQFLLSSIQNDEIRKKLEGAKVGDKIAVGEAGDTVTVLEAYSIVLPQAPAAEEAPQAQGSDSSLTGDAAAEAPAADSTATA